MSFGFYKWGTKDLLVAKGSYNPPSASNGIIEINILPDAGGNPASILQQGGRGRKRVSFNGYATLVDYQSFEIDYFAAIKRTFTDIDGLMMLATIESFKASRNSGTYPYEYSITLVEA